MAEYHPDTDADAWSHSPPPEPAPQPPPLPDVVRFRLDDGEHCPAVVTRRWPDGRADLRVILSADQAIRYARDGWWAPDYLLAVGNIPPEGGCEQGGEPGQFFIPTYPIPMTDHRRARSGK